VGYFAQRVAHGSGKQTRFTMTIDLWSTRFVSKITLKLKLIVLNYDATEDYDSGFFISDATLKLYNQSGQRIGLSEYHVYRGSLDTTKYQENKIKINRLVDGLLKAKKK